MEILTRQTTTDGAGEVDNKELAKPEADMATAPETADLVGEGLATVDYCVKQLRECGIGLHDEEIIAMLRQVPVANKDGHMDLRLVAQTAAEMILVLLKSSEPQLATRAPSVDPADQRPECEGQPGEPQTQTGEAES